MPFKSILTVCKHNGYKYFHPSMDHDLKKYFLKSNNNYISAIIIVVIAKI